MLCMQGGRIIYRAFLVGDETVISEDMRRHTIFGNIGATSAVLALEQVLLQLITEPWARFTKNLTTNLGKTSDKV